VLKKIGHWVVCWASRSTCRNADFYHSASFVGVSAVSNQLLCKHFFKFASNYNTIII